MKSIIFTGTALMFLGGCSHVSNEVTQDRKALTLIQYSEDQLRVGPENYFTGHVTISKIFSSGPFDDYQGARVDFDAAARTAWHKHPKGQTLVIISGEGRAQTEGTPVRVLMPGDTVWIPADTRHWHGGAPKSDMSHIAIHAPDEKGEVVTWMEHVSDEDYLANE